MDLCVAAALLLTPPGTPEPKPSPEHLAAIRPGVHHLAVEWEILDPRETRYVLTNTDEFDGDINMLRRRYRELKDAPKVADSFRLPSRAEANTRATFNRAYRKRLDQRREMEPDRADAIHGIMAEVDRRYQIWDQVRDAQCEFYYVTVRRIALAKLRDLVGQGAYLAADLPDEVPFEVFSELR